MKRLFLLLPLLFLYSACTTTQLIDHWKNPDIDYYEPQKVLIVGLTSNIEARQKFETQLKKEFEARGSVAMTSLSLFDPSLHPEKMTKEELQQIEKKLVDDGFDTIFFTKIIGVEDKIQYKENYHEYDETYRKFADEYLMYQDVFYNPSYYESYTIYHCETSMYCICPTKERELLWKGYIDVVDPTSINESVTDYINLAIAVLEHEQLILPKTNQIKKEKDELVN
ncbi:hypothetical protein [Kordia zhangzhouensis]|uniref:hypothetical protein n=1 Tax=Kordia zhangzhouensis TaxID=1620405 RepID=UPI0006298ADE|nr:hypothetical protein [Kordia zhangzhouensis]